MTEAAAPASAEIPPAKLRQVVAASSAGTIFEWYDFFVYAVIADVLRKNFFSDAIPEAQANVLTLLIFAAGFLVRPLGALVFGKVGDSSGRKGAFLITITIMGLATFAIGFLPTASQVGVWAPILLLVCRVLQGFALGGEYGGAAIYVAEHAPHKRRGGATGWIQTSAAIGLFGALFVVLITRATMGEGPFAAWGWRIPFLVSIGLLAVSVWIRLQLEESPAFKKLQDEGAISKRAYHESFFQWRNAKIVLLALFGIMMAQGVVWYTASFYTQFFLQQTLKVDSATVNLLMIAMVAISAPLYLVFASLSDRLGRKPVMLFGMLLMLAVYFPGFDYITRSANPPLARASAASPAVVTADPADCSFQLDLTGGAHQFSSSCDIARGALAAAGVSYTTEAGPADAPARVRVGTREIEAPSAEGGSTAEIRAARGGFADRLHIILGEAGYPTRVVDRLNCTPDPAEPEKCRQTVMAAPGPMQGWTVAEVMRVFREKAGVFAIMILFVIAATALYGPQAAALVELFPTRIRYTAMSLPYHIGTGWFGGLLPAIVFAINTATGQINAGLWFPFVVTAIAATVCFLFLPETKDRDIHA
jgi:MFS family permease